MKPIRRERDADSGNSIVYSSFHLHETGLTPIGAPSFEEWLECGRFIRHAEQSVHFWIGDWLAYGEAHFKEDYEAAIAITGYSYHTLRRDKYTAERIPLERRRSRVDIAIHHEVAPLEEATQERLLEKAATEQWTVRQIRTEKRREAYGLSSLPLALPILLPSPSEQTYPKACMEANHIYQGDALTILKTFPNESIDMVMTSPPYWALRDYGVDGQLGLEPSFEEYIQNICDVFDEVKRVLKEKGTCWINLGDTYATHTGKSPGMSTGQFGTNEAAGNNSIFYQDRPLQSVPEKCLRLIPFRFAIEMVNRGWVLRNTIIWHKPNAMPESVMDRFTEDFEYLFFFVQSQQYYFEQQFEPLADTTLPRYARGVSENSKHGEKNRSGAGALSAPRLNIKHINREDGGGGNGLIGHSGYFKANGEPLYNPDGRNKRSTWSISTKPFPDAHFAVYPEALCETPIKAGCPVGGAVLDPFIGSGTTAVVAHRLKRAYIGIELNPAYVQLAQQRIAD